MELQSLRYQAIALMALALVAAFSAFWLDSAFVAYEPVVPPTEN